VPATLFAIRLIGIFDFACAFAVSPAAVLWDPAALSDCFVFAAAGGRDALFQRSRREAGEK
jgi:hypothetical protein